LPGMAHFNLENKLETRKHSIFTLAQLFLHRSFALERFGCAVVHFGEVLPRAEVEDAVAKLLKEDEQVAVPVYREGGELDFLFVYPLTATRLAHPNKVADLNNPGSDHLSVMDEEQVSRLLTQLEPLGWRAVSRDCDWFVISRQ